MLVIISPTVELFIVTGSSDVGGGGARVLLLPLILEAIDGLVMQVGGNDE